MHYSIRINPGLVSEILPIAFGELMPEKCHTLKLIKLPSFYIQARKMLENAAESHTSIARFVRGRFNQMSLATDCNLMPAAAKPIANINPATTNSKSSEGTKYTIMPTKTESDQSPTTQLGSTLASHSLIPRIIRPSEKISDPAAYRSTPVMALLDLMTRMPTTAIKKPRKPNLPVSLYCTPYKAKMPRRINISVRM